MTNLSRFPSSACRLPFHPDVLLLEGKDGLDLVHRLGTGDLRALRDGEIRETLLTSNKGRILDHLFVLSFEGARYLLAAPGRGEAVRAWIDKYTFVEDVRCTSLSNPVVEMLWWEEEGDGMSETLRRLESSLVLAPISSITGIRALAWQDTGEGASVLDDLPVLSEDAWTRLRIAHRYPAPGAELCERFHPLEVEARPAVSFTKGCYVGQEVIARLDSYDKVQRILTAVAIDAPAHPVAGSVLRFEEEECGVLTSVVHEGSDRYLGLAVLRRSLVEPGSVLSLSDGTQPLRLSITVETHGGAATAEGDAHD